MKLNKSIIWVGLALTFAAQLFVPTRMILDREDILKNGTAYKFRLAPIDPADPFRGRYVYLQFADVEIDAPLPEDWNYQEEAFVSLSVGTDGFAKPVAVSHDMPATGDYVTANVYANDQKTHINYQFDRFYMEEFAAPLAEELARDAVRDTSQQAYGLIRIKNGEAVIEDVFLGDRSIRQAVREHSEQ